MPGLLKKDQVERNREMLALDDIANAIPRLKKLDGWNGYTEGVSNRQDPSECEGVSVNRRFRVTKLELRGDAPPPIKKIGGHVHVISESIAGMSNVRVIDLSGNSLCGNIPPEICSCHSLAKLNLSRNNFDGQIPKDINQLTSLRYLNLSNNALKGGFPRGLGKCHLLEKLILHHNHLSGELPAGVGDPNGDMCPLLRVLDVSDNPDLGGDVCIEMMGKLKGRVITHHHTYHSRDPGTGRALVEKGVKITHPDPCLIAIYNGQLAVDIIKAQHTQRNVRTLDIEFNAMMDLRAAIPQLASGMGVEGWEKLPQHKNLAACTGLVLDPGGWIVKIELENMGLDGEVPESICKLMCLRNLNLSYNQLGGTIPHDIGSLKSLIVLDLSCNAVISHTELYDPVLCQYAPNETSQSLHRQELRITRAKSAQRQQKKKRADRKEKTRLADEMAMIKQAMGQAAPKTAEKERPESSPAYREVDKAQGGEEAGNGRPKTAPAFYQKTPTTKGIAGVIPESIGQLKKLKWLYLNDNQLVGNIPLSIRTVPLLERVHLQNNRLSGEIPPNIGDPDEIDPATLKKCGMGSLKKIDVSGNPLLQGSVCLPIRSKPDAVFAVDRPASESSELEQECLLRSDKLFLMGASFASEDLPALLKQVPDFQQSAGRYQPQVEMLRVGTFVDSRVPMHRCERQRHGSRGVHYVPWQRVWLEGLEWLATIPPGMPTPINLYVVCHNIALHAADTKNIFRDKFLNQGRYSQHRLDRRRTWEEQDFDPNYALGNSGTAMSILDWERRQIMRCIDGRLRSDRLMVLKYIDQHGTDRGAPDWYAPFGHPDPDKGLEKLVLHTANTDKFRSSCWADKYEVGNCIADEYDPGGDHPWRSGPCAFEKGHAATAYGKAGEWILFDLKHQKKRDVVKVRLVNDHADRYGVQSFTLQRADEINTLGSMTTPTHFVNAATFDGVWAYSMEAQQDFELPTPCHSRFWKVLITGNHGATACGIYTIELWAETQAPKKKKKQQKKIPAYISSFFGGVDFKAKS
jgi:Leucine-rich repeat (LRR) protein